MIDKKKQDRLGKIFVSFFAILIILLGISSFFNGKLNYSNYWGGVVFAPIAIIIGLLLLYIIWFKWKVVEKNENTSYHNSKTDDFRKW